MSPQKFRDGLNNDQYEGLEVPLNEHIMKEALKPKVGTSSINCRQYPLLSQASAPGLRTADWSGVGVVVDEEVDGEDEVDI